MYYTLNMLCPVLDPPARKRHMIRQIFPVFSRIIGLFLLTFLLFASESTATPVDEAKGLLGQKKYGEVEKLLEKELGVKKPSAEVLELGMLAAYYQGKIVSADIYAEGLAKTDAKLGPGSLYVVGDIAALRGRNDEAVVRFLKFAASGSEKSPQRVRALAFICDFGMEPSAMKAYVDLLGANSHTYSKATSLFRRLFEKNAEDQALDELELLLQCFPTQVAEVVGIVYGVVSQGAFQEPKRRERCLRILTAAKLGPSALASFSQVFGALSPSLAAETRARLVLDTMKNWGLALPYTLIDSFMAALSGIADLELRAGLARELLAYEPLYRKSENRDDHFNFVYRVIANKQHFLIEGKEVLDGEKAMALTQALVDRYGEEALPIG
ncbi:MAG: hypothetical protein HQL31_11710, partial [Planctomycetes bacterium]|nr:hypothetical protein [Planctomycetota bacterium]